MHPKSAIVTALAEFLSGKYCKMILSPATVTKFIPNPYNRLNVKNIGRRLFMNDVTIKDMKQAITPMAAINRCWYRAIKAMDSGLAR